MATKNYCGFMNFCNFTNSLVTDGAIHGAVAAVCCDCRR